MTFGYLWISSNCRVRIELPEPAEPALMRLARELDTTPVDDEEDQ